MERIQELINKYASRIEFLYETVNNVDASLKEISAALAKIDVYKKVIHELSGAIKE